MTVLSSATAVRAPALVVIGGDASPPHRTGQRADGAGRELLLKSLPAAARVLAWHGSAAALRQAYERSHPACLWHEVASLRELTASRETYDLIVLSDGLDTIDDPAAVLQALRERAHPTTTLVLNLSHDPSLAMLQRWVEADLSDVADADDGERHRSLASASKLLMDTGWMPTLVDAVVDAPRDDAFARSALALAAAAGVPAATAQRQWRMLRGIVHAQATFEPCVDPERRANFAVVVPTTRDTQLRLNVDASPGLHEVGARVISVRRASSPADALARALEHVQEEWVLLCHQDVYFARSFGHRLAQWLDAVPADQRCRTLLGFAGVGVNAQRQGYEPAGFVIDRTSRFDHAASEHAVSIDELAVVLPRDSLLRIDPSLGWHLWATELCLQAICKHKFFARIVRAPLFHNSHTDHQLPAAFHDSAAILAAQYPDFGPIHTLCGVIDASFLAHHARAPS